MKDSSAADSAARETRPAPRVPFLLAASGVIVLLGAAFVRVPMALGIAAAIACIAGAIWVALAFRRWQAGLAALWMTASIASDLYQHRPVPAGGSGTIVTLAAFAVLVLGGAWLGSRNARD